jgi:hypothetical protein
MTVCDLWTSAGRCDAGVDQGQLSLRWGFAAPSPQPSPRRGEGDDLSLAPISWRSPGFLPPSPRRGEGARRAGEGAGQISQRARRASQTSKRRLHFAVSPASREGPPESAPTLSSPGGSPSQDVSQRLAYKMRHSQAGSVS